MIHKRNQYYQFQTGDILAWINYHCYTKDHLYHLVSFKNMHFNISFLMDAIIVDKMMRQ